MRPRQSCTMVATLGILIVGLGIDAEAQTPTVPIPVTGPCSLPELDRPDPTDAAKTIKVKPTAALTGSFQSGDAALLKKDVIQIRDHIKGKGLCKVEFSSADYLLITWVADTALGDTALLAAVVHEGSGEGYVSRLPGLSTGGTPKLYQIFVSNDEHDVLASVYMSTREENPLLKQIPEVAEKILEPMLALLSANMSTETSARKRAQTVPAGWATVARVDLPYARATVKIEMRAALAVTEAALKNASTKLKNRLTLIDVPYSIDAKNLATALDTVVVTNAEGCLSAKPPDSCLSKLDPEFKNKYNGTCSGCSEEETKARRLVDAKFRTLVADLHNEELSGKAELRNVPLTKYSFGLMTAFSFLRSSNAPRVKLDEGVLEHDPLDRQLTMVTFNVAFNRYDSDAFTISRPERHRWFIGAAITPTFGVGFGYSFLPVRGLGINVGYAVLGISTAAGGRQVGEAPASTNDPFKLGGTETAFFGLSYNFK